MMNQSATRDITIFYLQMLAPDQAESPRGFPENIRLERVQHPTPELARWLYGAVGGPWHWKERLNWSYQQWQDELSEQGSELWLLSLDGTPAGYCQLAAEITGSSQLFSTETEILYFGLMPWALEATKGQGIGAEFLRQMITQAWTLGARHALPEVSRVWVHTCSLDSQFALPNYQKRGFELYGSKEVQEVHLLEPLTSWQAQFQNNA